MHPTLDAIRGELDQLVNATSTIHPESRPISLATGNWSFPGITKLDLARTAAKLRDSITARETDTIAGDESRLNDLAARIAFLRQNTLPQLWANAGAAVPTYLVTLLAVEAALDDTVGPVNAERQAAEATAAVRKVSARARSLDALLNQVGARTADIDGMLTRIEQASQAAEQLPTDLEQLRESREAISKLRTLAASDGAAVTALRATAVEADTKIAASRQEADAVLDHSQKAYSAATSVGLALAFSDRSKALARSTWSWVAGLVCALAVGGWFGSMRLAEMSTLLRDPTVSATSVVLNFALSLLSVGGPIWFGWLATKQIGQRFRLSEDYAFKASISRAYEGYRKEAARIHPELEAKLLGSALSRLDELPLRLIETATHGSPWHEFAASQLASDALKMVPDFMARVTALAKTELASVKTKQTPTSSAQEPPAA